MRRAAGRLGSVRSVRQRQARIPKFPLTAGTGRQIIFSLPHGEAVPMRPMPFGHRGMPSASGEDVQELLGVPLHVLRCFERRVAARHLVDLGQEGYDPSGATRPSLCRDVWESFETSKHQVVPPAGRLSKVSRSDSGIPPSWRASEEPRSGVRFSTMRRQ